MSVYHRMEEERDALEKKVEELERKVALLLPCWIKATEERDDLMAALREAVDILEEIEAQGVLLGSDTEQPSSLYTLGRITALFGRCKNLPLGGE